MKINFSENNYSNIVYRIKWNLTPLAQVKTNVESLNDFREARSVINQIKKNIKKR